MSTINVTCLSELLEKSDDALLRIRKDGACAYLVTPTHEWAVERKIQLKEVCPTGVEVLTYDQLISQLWELFGDGTRLIDSLERRVLLRPYIWQAELLEFNASPKLVEQLAAFIEEAVVASSLLPGFVLSDAESRILGLVSLYERKLELEGLVEPAQAERKLIDSGSLAGMHFVFESPDLESAHIRGFIGALDGMADVSVISQQVLPGHYAHSSSSELAALRSRLFTGKGGLQATGAVHVGVAHGSHAAPDLLANYVQMLHQEGMPYDDIVICMANPSEAHPRLHRVFANAKIPFHTCFSIPSVRTGLGAAVREIETVLNPFDDEEAFTALVSLASGPYAGISKADGRALQMRWRERFHSTQEERLLDIREGFAQGHATASVMKERLAPLAELLDAPRKQRIELLFENEKKANVKPSVLLDDQAAAEVILDYLEACERLTSDPDAWEMANLAVPLERSYPEGGTGVRIISSSALGIMKPRAIIMPDLDSAHYPMATMRAPFYELMVKLGIERPDTLAQRQRLVLANMVESAQERLVFCRSTHDKNGDESCQSALFEELVSVYRGSADEDGALPINAVPQALSPYLVSLNEADVFFSGESDSVQKGIERGVLASRDSYPGLVEDAKGSVIPFSPTALEDYYRCPYRWFASRKVGYNSMDAEFDSAAQGNFAHATMERFYREFLKGSHDRVTPANLPEALEIASRCFREELEYERNRQRKPLYLKTHYDICACDEMLEKVLELVVRDSEFLPGFYPTHFELSLGHKHDIPLSYAGVPVRGKVDRIDIDKDGNAVVIDYKLSSLQADYGLAKGIQIPHRIQTDIYAALVQRHFKQVGEDIRVIGSVYRSYATNSLRGVYSAQIDWGPLESARQDYDALPSRELTCSYEDYLLKVEEKVAECMAKLSSGVISPTPLSKDVCKYCKALAFCPKAVS